MLMKKQFNTVVILLLLISVAMPLSAQENFVFYKSEKCELRWVSQGIKRTLFFRNFEDDEKFKIQYRVFDDEKVFIGKEDFTNNKQLLDYYYSRYLKKAVEENKSKHDIEYFEKDFKIVTEKRNNKINFYYYHTGINSILSLRKPHNLSKHDEENDWGWSAVSAKKFLLEVIVNDKTVMFKEFHMK